MIRDRIKVYNNWKDLQKECYSCKDMSHIFNNCPKVIPTQIKDIIIQKFLYTTEQSRYYLARTKKIKSQNALLMKKEINLKCQGFILDAMENELFEDEELMYYERDSEPDQSSATELGNNNSNLHKKLFEGDDTSYAGLYGLASKGAKQRELVTTVENRRKSALLTLEPGQVNPIMEETDSPESKRLLNPQSQLNDIKRESFVNPRVASKREFFMKLNTMENSQTKS